MLGPTSTINPLPKWHWAWEPLGYTGPQTVPWAGGSMLVVSRPNKTRNGSKNWMSELPFVGSSSPSPALQPSPAARTGHPQRGQPRALLLPPRCEAAPGRQGLAVGWPSPGGQSDQTPSVSSAREDAAFPLLSPQNIWDLPFCSHAGQKQVSKPRAFITNHSSVPLYRCRSVRSPALIGFRMIIVIIPCDVVPEV